MVECSLSMREVPGLTPGFSSDMVLHQHLILFVAVEEKAQSHGLKFGHILAQDSFKVTLLLVVGFYSFREMKKPEGPRHTGLYCISICSSNSVVCCHVRYPAIMLFVLWRALCIQVLYSGD